MFCDEKTALDYVVDIVKAVDMVPVVFIGKRVPVKNNPYAYDAIFIVQTSENNGALINRLIFAGDSIEFLGSQADASGNIILDYLQVQVRIQPKKGV